LKIEFCYLENRFLLNISCKKQVSQTEFPYFFWFPSHYPINLTVRQIYAILSLVLPNPYSFNNQAEMQHFSFFILGPK